MKITDKNLTAVFVFTYEPATDRYLVTVTAGDAVLASKALTNVEFDGLTEIVDFGNLPVAVTDETLNSLLESAFFDNDGQETNFELLVAEYSA